MFDFLDKCKDSILWGYDYDKVWRRNAFYLFGQYSNYLKDFEKIIEEKRLYWKAHGKYYGNSGFNKYSARHAAFRGMIDVFNCVYNQNKKNEFLIYKMSKALYDEHEILESIGKPFQDMLYIKWGWKEHFKKYEQEKEVSKKMRGK